MKSLFISDTKTTNLTSNEYKRPPRENITSAKYPLRVKCWSAQSCWEFWLDYKCVNLQKDVLKGEHRIPNHSSLVLNRVTARFCGKSQWQCHLPERPVGKAWAPSFQALQKCLCAHCAQLAPAVTAREPLDSTVQLQEISAWLTMSLSLVSIHLCTARLYSQLDRGADVIKWESLILWHTHTHTPHTDLSKPKSQPLHVLGLRSYLCPPSSHFFFF